MLWGECTEMLFPPPQPLNRLSCIAVLIQFCPIMGEKHTLHSLEELELHFLGACDCNLQNSSASVAKLLAGKLWELESQKVTIPSCGLGTFMMDVLL